MTKDLFLIAMIELIGISLLERQLAVLRAMAIEDIHVVAGYRRECIEPLDLKVWVNRQYSITNMVYTLFCAEAGLDCGDDILVSYGDIVFTPSVVEALQECDEPLCVVVDQGWQAYWESRMDDPIADLETLKVNGRGRILELGKRPDTYADIMGQYIGLIKVRRDIVAEVCRHYHAMDRKRLYDSQVFVNMYMTSFIQSLIDSGLHVQSVPIMNDWLEIDTVKDLIIYSEMYHSGELRQFIDLDL